MKRIILTVLALSAMIIANDVLAVSFGDQGDSPDVSRLMKLFFAGSYVVSMACMVGGIYMLAPSKNKQTKSHKLKAIILLLLGVAALFLPVIFQVRSCNTC